MSWRLALALIACLVVAGCAADSDKRPDDNRFGGFYGGVSGGAVP
jgi:hypothetical protein